MDDRTQTELIVKTIALHVAVLTSVGHLMSLQNRSWHRSRDTLWQLAWFIAVPTYPFATLVDRAIRIVRIAFSKGRFQVSLSYCFDSVLGLHVETPKREGHTSVALLSVPMRNLRVIPRKRGLPWIGRLVVLLCLMTQAVGTLILSGRRLQADQMGEVDIRNALTSLGGLLVHVMSVIIILRGNRWKYVPTQADTILAPVASPAPSSTGTKDDMKPAPRDDEKLGVVARLITTATILNCWYFRFHIRDTIGLAVDGVLNHEQYPTTFVRPDPGGSLLRYLVWLAWPAMIFHAQSEKGRVVLMITLFLSVGFPVEDLAKNQFPKWKDPLADALYVF